MKPDVREITIEEVTDWLTKLKESGGELLRNYKSAFGEDVPRKGDPFNYYIVDVDGASEAITRIRLPNTFSSLARVVLKRTAKAPGWLYVKVIIEQVLIPECLLRKNYAICANTYASPGGKKAFEDFESHLPASIERIECGQFGPHIFIK